MATVAHGRRRSRMQWALGALALAPTLSGIQLILRGADGAPGESPRVSSTIDGELRYANVFKTAGGAVILSQLGVVEDSPVLTAALGTIFVGGLARLLSWKQAGRPHGVAIGATALEVGVVPVILLWRRRVASGRA
ncbi:MAG: DUF4345 domain-containing protein [Rhodococcus sp. (in: high G+C Gram-positive bacteria)]|uniref:DUF4345 domain-containing protein n=1 Tax=Rhodococcus sp. TaxID=1831 RepID=UPI002AD67593|nr:DUF4345 domain-containing protein [Rhodococcus sp. (in: high G+C Gram-positive bacteria)]